MSFIFSVDTSSEYIVLSLGHTEQFLAGQTVFAKRAHQAYLHPLIENFLKGVGVSWQDIEGLGVVVGPGSFTGLRIGVTAVKGFAWALKKPVVALSALDCLADNLIGTQGTVSSIIDAKRDRVYGAVYSLAKEGQMKRQGDEHIMSPEEWKKRLKPRTILLGDGAERYASIFLKGQAKKFSVAPKHLWHTQPISLWNQSRWAFQSKRIIATKRLEPAYLQLPEAEETYQKNRKRTKGQKKTRR